MNPKLTVVRWLQGTNWAQRLVLLLLAATLMFGAWALIDHVRDRAQTAATKARDMAENANDNRLSVQARTLATDATAHETNANAAAVDRQLSEANANHADARRVEANANTQRTRARTRATKEAYETSLNANAALLPAVTDAQLCAELRARGRVCPAN